MPPKFKPTRERKRKVIARQQHEPSQVSASADSNTSIIIATKAEREARRQTLRDELRAQQPKISAKKSKRLDKYIEKKLKKDEAADLVRKLEKEREKYDGQAASGLQSSKRLKRKFGDFVEGQVHANGGVVVEEVQPPSNRKRGRPQHATIEDDADSQDSFEEEHQDAFDPEAAPEMNVTASTDDAWMQKRVAPTQGTGLAQPLQLGANGMPIIPMRGSKSRKEEKSLVSSVEPDQPDDADEESWDGFSDDKSVASTDSAQDSDTEMDSEGEDSKDTVDPRLKSIDSSVLDALLAELERSDGSDIEPDLESETSHADDVDERLSDTDESSEPDEDTATDSEEDAQSSDTSEPAEEASRLKTRTSAFKSWATQQLNQSMGHTPFYEKPQLDPPDDAEPQVWEKPAAGFKLGVKDIDGPRPDRRAYTVHVSRSEEIEESRSHLPILQREQEIMEAIHNNPVIVIKGDTGSGKTTQIPQFLFEAGFGDPNGPFPGMIGVTQPRRVAAVSMAKRVAEEMGASGDRVAHQIRFDTTVSSKTALKFMTDGVLLRELSQDLLLKKYSAIVIDEAHERSVNTDLLIGMLSKIVPARMKKTDQNPDPRPLKLIIMSATLNINDFLHEKLFSTGTRPPVVEAEGRQHRVTVHFALKSRADYLEEVIEKVKRAHRKLPRGGILVFLTGQNEIKFVLSRLRKELAHSAQSPDEVPRMHVPTAEVPLETEDFDAADFALPRNPIDGEDDIDILTDEAEADKEFEISDDEEEQPTASNPGKDPANRDPYDSVHLLPLYSQLPTKEQMRIFQPPPDRSRLIVLATNVAETSLTIPGIRYVFDCGRSKERKYNTDTNVQSFEVDYTSKASAQQRAGRAGRTGPGHCWRLYSSAVYEQFFPDHAEPEILRTPAESLVLQLKSFRYPRPVVDFPFPSPPSSAMLKKAETLLRNLGAIEGSNGTLTELGKKLSLYPLSPRLGKVLIRAIDNPVVLLEVLMLVSALSVEDIFVNAAQVHDNDQDDNDTQDDLKQAYGRAHANFSKLDKTSDAIKTLTAVHAYLDSEDKEFFCKQNFLRPKAMVEISQLYAQLRSMVYANNPTLRTIKPNKKLSQPLLTAINTTTASGYIDQIALRYDAHPTPPVLPRRPTRSIDVPYLPLIPLPKTSSAVDIIDRAVFLHPSSLLARQPVKSLPQYIVYRHLQTSQSGTIAQGENIKTRMFTLCALDANALLELVRDTGLIEYGKVVPKTKVEDVPNARPKERICWVSTELKGVGGGVAGWPLPPTKVRQVMDLKSTTGWRVVDVIA